MKERSVGKEILTLLKENVRDYIMYIALVVIMAFFTWRPILSIRPGTWLFLLLV